MVDTITTKRADTSKLSKFLCILLAIVLALGLVPHTSIKEAYADPSGSAYLQVGSRVDYGGHFTNYFDCDGTVGYCMDPRKPAPPNGTYNKVKVVTEGKRWTQRSAAAALWYGYGGPGFDPSLFPSTYYGGRAWTNNDYYAYTHFMVTHVVTGDFKYALNGTTEGYYDWVLPGFMGGDDSTLGKLKARQDQVPQSFVDAIYQLETGDNYQRIISFEPSGDIDLQKASANTDITDGHPCYSLEGAEYGIYADPGCNTEVSSIRTDANGYAKSDQLNVGTYYVKEKSAPKGYALDTDAYPVTIAPGGTVRVNGDKVYDLPQNDPAAMVAGKVDFETTLNMPQGSASLAGAEFTVRYYNNIYDSVGAAEASGKPTRTWTFRTDEDGYAEIDDAFKASGDDLYYDSAGIPTIPIGTLLIQETKAPTGYHLSDNSVYLRSVKPDGFVETVNTFNAPIVKEQVYRGDIEFVKARESDQSRLGYIPFKITSTATGESHIIVTDANGEAKTQSTWNAHTEKTNANDAALRADGTIDESKLDPFAGIYFFGTADPEHQKPSQVDNAKGALPYDTYMIEELVVAKNDGLTMIEIPVTVYKDAYTIDMGTMDNQFAAQAGISTVARNGVTGGKTASADTYTKLIDRVQYVNLDVSGGAAYELKAELMDVVSGEPVRDSEGNAVTGSARFVPTSANGFVEVTLDFDSRAYANRDVVFFETLNRADNGSRVAEHKDLTDYEQTIRIVGQSLKTKAWDATDGDSELSTDTVSTIKDTVTYRNLVAGAEYALTGTLWVKNIEMTSEGTDITVEPLYDEDGNHVSATRLFTPEYSDGEVDVTLICNTVDLTNRSIVVYETLTREGEFIAEHADPYDEEQTVTVRAPKIGTMAQDAVDGDPILAADRASKLIDTISHENLTPGHEYTLVGTIMVKDHEVREDGTKVTKADPLLDADGNPVTATTTFTPESHKGTTNVEFTFDTTGLDGKELVVYEKLYRDGKEVGNHEDPNDEGQSFIVVKMTVDTELVSSVSKTHTLTADSEAALTDTVYYSDAVVGADYTAYAMLIDPESGLPVMQYADDEVADEAALEKLTGMLAHALGVAAETEDDAEDSTDADSSLDEIYANLAPYPHGVDVKLAADLLEQNPDLAKRMVYTLAEFTAEGTYGMLPIDYKLDARGLEGTKATSVVLIVRDDPFEAASGEIDLEAEKQTVEFVSPEIGTYATDKTDGDKNLIISEDATVSDEVEYKGLTPGKEYVLEGVLYDKATQKPLLVDDKQVTATKYFVPAAADGKEVVDFTFNSTSLSGHELVVYEYLYREMETPSGESERVKVAEHADIESASQTVVIDGPELPTTGESYDKTGDAILTAIFVVMGILVASAGAIYVSIYLKRRNEAVDANSDSDKSDTSDEKLAD